MRDGLYCLEDGYEHAGDHRFLRVNVDKESVELRHGGGWFPIPEKGYVRGWGGVVGDLVVCVFIEGIVFAFMDAVAAIDAGTRIWYNADKLVRVDAGMKAKKRIGERSASKLNLSVIFSQIRAIIASKVTRPNGPSDPTKSLFARVGRFVCSGR